MPLFLDIDDFRKYVTVNKSATMVLLQPHVNRAVSKYIIPILGTMEYNEMVGTYTAGSISQEHIRLLPYVQNCAALYAVALALPTMAVHFSDMGVQEVQSKDGTSSGVRQWLYSEVQGQMTQAADEAAEDLLQFLESKAIDYSDWQTSAQFTVNRELFINSATELSQYVETRGSRRVWVAVRSYVKNFIEGEWILPYIGQAQFDELKAQIGTAPTATLTAENELLLLKIKPVVAFAAIAKAMPFLNIMLSSDGLRMPSTGNYGLGQSTKSADIELRQKFVTECHNAAMGYLTNLQKFILKNIADYPLIEADEDANPVVKSEQPYELPDQSNSTAFRVP